MKFSFISTTIWRRSLFSLRNKSFDYGKKSDEYGDDLNWSKCD